MHAFAAVFMHAFSAFPDLARCLSQAGGLAVNLTFLSTMFTDDYLRLSRPAYYVDVAIEGDASVDLYVAFSAEHAVNTETQKVTWSTDAQTGSVRIGNADQKILVSDVVIFRRRRRATNRTVSLRSF